MIKSRTRKEALQHILTCFDDGDLGAVSTDGCVYRHKNNYCSVGCLFTEQQLDWIRNKRVNEASITVLARKIGEKNLFHMTGMDACELKKIQLAHDDWAMFNYDNGRKFRKMIRTLIDLA